jgi:DNA-binding response OmpR family regulator
VLGALFKSRQEQKSATELIVMVTPEITTPVNRSDMPPLPEMPKKFMPLLLQPGGDRARSGGAAEIGRREVTGVQMANPGESDRRQLKALMISPDRELARQFLGTATAERAFLILAELKAYPQLRTLEIRLRQLRPEVVLLDLVTDFEQAATLVGAISISNPGIQMIGLHARNDSAAIVRSLRQGAAEFLYAPFDAAIQEQALARVRRLIEPQGQTPHSAGTVAVFASAKPGSGASTLAAQTAFALGRLAGIRVLLADLDPMSGTVTFYLKAAGAAPGGVVKVRHGVDVFPAGMAPGDSLDIARLKPEYQELKFTLHRKLLERINLDAGRHRRRPHSRRSAARPCWPSWRRSPTCSRPPRSSSISDEVLHEVFGLGPLEPLLQDPTISDILVNGHKQVYVERKGLLELTNVRFHDDAHLLRIIDKIVSRWAAGWTNPTPWWTRA